MCINSYIHMGIYVCMHTDVSLSLVVVPESECVLMPIYIYVYM